MQALLNLGETRPLKLRIVLGEEPWRSKVAGGPYPRGRRRKPGIGRMGEELPLIWKFSCSKNVGCWIYNLNLRCQTPGSLAERLSTFHFSEANTTEYGKGSRPPLTALRELSRRRRDANLIKRRSSHCRINYGTDKLPSSSRSDGELQSFRVTVDSVLRRRREVQ